MGPWPHNVGITAIEIYFPSQCVDQNDLEQHDGVSTGKYTIGLGQQKMGFCSDREDINSLCLTVVQNLLDNYNIKPSEIGRLEVGTETIIDKSKSVKTVLMQLFEPFGITDIEGIDTTNACFGGTAALFNAISWIESSAWNGRLALVVAADIAVYAKGSARPTGGAGAVAMLVGPDASLVFDRGLRGYYTKHAYDFYKPDLTSEYPVVDGKLSVQCYLEALDQCYNLYCHNVAKKLQVDVTVSYFDALLFHTPYCKLVQKSLARLTLNDFSRTCGNDREKLYPGLDKFKNINLQDTYFDREIEKSFMAHSNDTFASKTKPSLLVASQVGNMYTSSLYGGLVSYLTSKDVSEILGNKVGLFSYGSGLASSFFSLTISKDPNQTLALQKIKSNLSSVQSRLNQRTKVTPEKFEATLELRQKSLHKVPYEPLGSITHFFPSTFYLTKIDEKHRRFYERSSVSTVITNGHS